MMLNFVAATLWLAAGQDAGTVPVAPPLRLLSTSDGRDAGVLLYDEMLSRIQRRLPPQSPTRKLGPLLRPDHLEPGADLATRLSVEMQRTQLRLVELEVVATRENPEVAALEERIERFADQLRRLRNERELPDRSLLARNRQQLVDHVKSNLAALRENETSAHPLRKLQLRLANDYLKLMR